MKIEGIILFAHFCLKLKSVSLTLKGAILITDIMVEAWMKNRATKQYGSIAMSDHLKQMEKKRKNRLKNVKSDIKKSMQVSFHMSILVAFDLLISFIVQSMMNTQRI